MVRPMPHISSRGQSAPSSPIRKLVPHADGARARGIHVYHLNIGQPDIDTPETMRENVRTGMGNVVAYSPSGGEHDFRDFLFGYYRKQGVDLDPPDLIVTTGGSEAIIFAFSSCLDPGDGVLIPDPMYANYLGFASMLGNHVVPIPTRVEDGYHLPDDLHRFVTPECRAILLCNPSNPTGAVYTEDEVQRVIDLAIRHDLFLIADEVYREFIYEGSAARSLLTYDEIADRGVVVDSLSKRYSLCGGRIGCLVSKNRQVTASSLKFAQARLSPPTLAQLAGVGAGSLGAAYFDEIREEYRKRRDIVFDALRSVEGVLVHRPEGAFYQMARLPVDDAENYVRFLLDEFSHNGKTTMVAPGAGFYATPGAGRDEVRIAYVLNEDDLAASMDIMVRGLAVYPGRRIG